MGGDAIATPNFDRFGARSVTFDNHYVGSLPCMPPRRDRQLGPLDGRRPGQGDPAVFPLPSSCQKLLPDRVPPFGMPRQEDANPPSIAAPSAFSSRPLMILISGEADETGNKAVDRVVINFFRRANLLQHPTFKQHNPVSHGHRSI